VGNIRTAIFNWLFARGAGGTFIIRVEDTDQARKVEGSTDELLDALRWLGLDWDEGPDKGGDYGPYFQSQRLDLYHRVAARLQETGNAYRCYCTPERLAQLRERQRQRKEPLGYDRLCRSLGDEEHRAREAKGENSVLRFAMPLDGSTSIDDLIRGNVSFENRLVDDFVVLKSDGYPTYHLANVVDDHHMEISHVLRGEDWLPSTSRHVLVYRSLGWGPPKFGHFPMILAPDRSKLGKRHGAVSALQYRRSGYLPQAMINFLALLGWSLDDKTEIFSIQELVNSFSLERVARPGAVFNRDKLSWMNGYYIRRLGREELADALLDYWRRYPPAEFHDLPDRSHILRIVPLVQERLKTLEDAAPLVAFFYSEKVEYETALLVQKGMDPPATKNALVKALAELQAIETFDAATIEGVSRPLAEELGIKAGQLFGSLRIATTGQRVAPPLFETMEVLGRDRCLAAVKDAVARL
jgi:glutamyl-tRNA synthetase